MSKIIVTGGAGFIGSHLVDRLLEEGHDVIVLDNMTEGKRINLPMHHPRLRVDFGNIFDAIGYIFNGVDVVFHLAALTRPRESFVQPDNTTLVNVQGTLKILQHCKKYKIKRVVFVSSAAVYGFQDTFPITENAVPLPVSPYGLTKLQGEQWCQLYERVFGLEINCIRPFNVYGPRQNPLGGYAAAVPQFINWLKNNERPFMRGNGEQVRDFIYVQDLVDLLIRAAFTNIHGETFNGGSGVSTAIKDVYALICKLMQKEIKPDHHEPVVEPETKADIMKARIWLGWEPKTTLEDGLLKTIAAL